MAGGEALESVEIPTVVARICDWRLQNEGEVAQLRVAKDALKAV